MFITLLKTIILGIVEGITEWLPISSTGHLIIFQKILNLGMSKSFVSMFDVVIQLGAIMAVVVIYFRKLWPFHTSKNAPSKTQFSNPQTEGAAGSFQKFADRYIYMDRIVLWLKIIVSVIPAIIIGFPLNDWMDEHLYNPQVVSAMLIIYGILFILIENRNKNKDPRVSKISRISFKDALFIGIFQCLAMVPGTSRSGATIIGGILIGLSRTTAAEYTFYLAIPTMLGASVLKLAKFGLAFTALEAAVLLLGSVVSFVVSIFVIKFLMNYIRRHDFKVFGWYRIVLGVIVILLGIAGAI
ncbi:undecaprenyl-diphosphate phosphatase [Bilifractor sp. LCP19S3_H10]|uniref:undecaprenyl-diphosphate phosphatase n=1 Tax=Bilifractor sp. LCP19S3_H10 TaxID=3438736 RepID=UPI003F906D32